MPRRCWIPVEVTESAGFLQAWQDGARSGGRIFPATRPFCIPFMMRGSCTSRWASWSRRDDAPPSSEKIVSAYQEEVGKFIDQEISQGCSA